MADKEEYKEKDKVEIDFGAGEIGFGGIFKGRGNLSFCSTPPPRAYARGCRSSRRGTRARRSFVDLAAKLNEEGAVEKRGEIRGLPGNANGVYGCSIKTMADKPVIESFGNIRETAKGPVIEEVREPIVDVFDEGDHIMVIAELPGVSEHKVKIEVAGDILNLTASDEDKKYVKEILLPGKAKPAPLKTTCKNGILEIALEKER
jgi:HSP20 family protein